MNERRDLVVVGGGLLGLAAARSLTRRGRDVVVLEQAALGHPASGSKGSCRIFRFGYEDPWYVRLARPARQLWTELEDAAGERLLHPVPQLTFGEQMPVVREAMRQAGARYELLSARQATDRFPAVAADGPVLLELESSVIAADRALAVLAAGLPDVRSGVRVTALADDGRRVSVSTDAGLIDAGSVIVCAGPWTARLLATAGIIVPSEATQEQVAYLEPTDQDATGQAPIFIAYGDQIPYGLPVPGSARYKVGIHHSGPTVDPGQLDQAADRALVARIEHAARRYLPGFDPLPVALERCVYDNTPDTDFVVGRIGNVVIGSGTSGHGFKFGPLLGEWLAALVTGEDGAMLTPPSRFAADRFS